MRVALAAVCAAAICTADGGARVLVRADVPDSLYRALGAEPQFAAAVKIVGASGAITGSGVVVAPRWVLTAGHVAQDRQAGSLRVQVADVMVGVKRIVMHPGYQPSGPAHTPNDQALLELDADAPVGAAPLSPSLPSLHSRAVLVGYGAAGIGERDTIGTRRAAQNRIDQIGGGDAGTAHLLMCDLDIPGQGSANALGDSIPEPLEGIATGGDSGGPLFVKRGLQWELVGTFSRGQYQLPRIAANLLGGTIGIWVGIQPSLTWIRETTGAR